MTDGNPALDLIVSKLDILIAISRIANKDKIASYSDEVRRDPVGIKILELTETPAAYGDVVRAVSEATNTSEITVKRKLAELRDLGALAVKKAGRDAYYENTGLLV